MTPDMSADTCDGATGCAFGSQTWSGMAPALVPNQTSSRTKTTSHTGAGSRGAAAPKAPNDVDPASAPRMANATMRAAVATCVIARYR